MTDDADVTVRTARPADELGVRRVLDAAMLETDAVDDALARGDVLVAVAGESIVGALVLVPHAHVDLPAAIAGDRGMHVNAVAVRRRRRDSGIGRALVAAALADHGRLTVAFEPDVSGFYEALGFTGVFGTEETTDDRAWSVRERNASLDV